MERDVVERCKNGGNCHFNSRAHVERDNVREVAVLYIVISTHALTWSATQKEFPVKNDITDFNSRAHVERDHLMRADVIKTEHNFNSRAHVERDNRL